MGKAWTVARVLGALGIAGAGSATAMAQASGATTAGIAGSASGSTAPPVAAPPLLAGPNAPSATAGPGQTAHLADYTWVERELASGNLTPAEMAYLKRLPVSITDTVSSATPPATGQISGTAAAADVVEPHVGTVAHATCDAQDIFGLTLASYSSYVGFSIGNGKYYPGDITELSAPNVYFNSDWGYVPIGTNAWITSQPGPPTPWMVANTELGVGYLVDVAEVFVFSINFGFRGTGQWAAACASD